jgi:hypothetical protein
MSGEYPRGSANATSVDDLPVNPDYRPDADFISATLRRPGAVVKSARWMSSEE